MSNWYRLDENKNVVGPVSLAEGAAAFQRDRTVARTKVYEGCEVSTVFLALDHSFGGGRPLVFETLVFGGPLDQEMDRYATWDEAVAGHARIVEKCQPIMTEHSDEVLD